MEFIATLDALEKKITQVSLLNEDILSELDTQGIEEEILATDAYMLEIDIKLRTVRSEKEGGLQSSSVVTMPRSKLSVHTPSAHSAEPISDKHAQLNLQNNSQTLSDISYVSNASQYHRLPKLSLPTFKGDILQSQTFWDSFETTVHLNTNLSDIQKFSYLKSLLECDASRTIDGFALTNANYKRAIELLKERYGQQHKITHAIMQALLQLPAPLYNLQSVRSFYDKMETHIRNLESIGQQQDTYGDLLVPVILEKLPADIKRNLARERGDTNWKLCDLRRAIYRELDIMEAGSASYPEVAQFMKTASLYAGTNHAKKAKFDKSESLNVKKQTFSCPFCHEKHKPTECSKYCSPSERISVFEKDKLCYNCLGIKETAVDAAILFDEGSQKSFITQQLADQLQLPVDGIEMLNIASFGGITTRV
ncbi:uncharacterized protein LOC127842104 [Dreissena polymorpha]|uniref:uncharacterized protein LOC127842104 n=1 Tax=Dreissena polymorpha TaxID=45954 RepID=UPI002264FC12|nr:uncharacterized protein LOC127842104 [Dreissena polymorpha]